MCTTSQLLSDSPAANLTSGACPTLTCMISLTSLQSMLSNSFTQLTLSNSFEVHKTYPQRLMFQPPFTQHSHQLLSPFWGLDFILPWLGWSQCDIFQCLSVFSRCYTLCMVDQNEVVVITIFLLQYSTCLDLRSFLFPSTNPLTSLPSLPSTHILALSKFRSLKIESHWQLHSRWHNRQQKGEWKVVDICKELYACKSSLTLEPLRYFHLHWQPRGGVGVPTPSGILLLSTSRLWKWYQWLAMDLL